MKHPKYPRLAWRFLLPWIAPAVHAATVTTCDEAGLRAALAGGGTVEFACDGVITLSQTLEIGNSVSLNGHGRNVTISGGGAVRVFNVSAGASLTLAELTIANGISTNGGGLYNDGGEIALDGVSFVNNLAKLSQAFTPSDHSMVQGGAIYHRAGLMTASNCLFAFNVASHRTEIMPGGVSGGGAILNAASLVLLDCRFETNRSIGGWGGAVGVVSAPPGYDTFGGAIRNDGLLTIRGARFLGNQAMGGDPGTLGGPGAGATGGSGGNAFGGAIYNQGHASVAETSFRWNLATGRDGLAGSVGQLSPTFPGGMGGIGGTGGTGGNAEGAGFFNAGTGSLINNALIENVARGGKGGAGGKGGGGVGPGGFGGRGGRATGAAVFDAEGNLHATNLTVALNRAEGGLGGIGGDPQGSLLVGAPGANGGGGGNGGQAIGAGWYSSLNSASEIYWSTFASNTVTGGIGGTGAAGICGRVPPCGAAGTNGASGPANGAGLNSSNRSLVLKSTLFASHLGGPIFQGEFIDGGNNICADASAPFSSPSSRINVDPLLGPLADNGGPTLTLFPQAGSPAIDTGGDTDSPATDQRGFPRHLGARNDVGSVEANFLRIERLASGQMRLHSTGIPGRSYTLEGTADLNLPWSVIESKSAAIDGSLSYSDQPGNASQRYFRLNGQSR